MAKRAAPPIGDAFRETKISVQAPARADRVGKRLVAGHFDEVVARRLKVLAALQGRTVHSLLAEALDLLFERHRQVLAGLGDLEQTLPPPRRRRTPRAQ